MPIPEDPPAISERVFLVGCPRSGTTLLQSMLMSHSRIESFPETKFFAHGFGGHRRWVLHETLRGWYLWYLLAHWLVENGYMDWEKVYAVPVSWSKDRMVEVFRDTLDHLTNESGKDIWVEKTPRHLHFIDVICDHLPNAKFVHIVRDGRAVVASLHQLARSSPEKWGTYRSIDAAIRRWNRSICDAFRYTSGDTHIMVGYNSLMDVPEETLRRITAFLNVDYDSGIIDHFQEEAQRVIKQHESWKARTTSSELQNRGLDKFRAVFSDEEQTYIESRLDWSSYRELGFSPL